MGVLKINEVVRYVIPKYARTTHFDTFFPQLFQMFRLQNYLLVRLHKHILNAHTQNSHQNIHVYNFCMGSGKHFEVLCCSPCSPMPLRSSPNHNEFFVLFFSVFCASSKPIVTSSPVLQICDQKNMVLFNNLGPNHNGLENL
jgi:hypothetical protein